RTAGRGPGSSGPGPAERRPVRISEPPRGPAEDPGLAGGRLRPLLEAAGARDVRLPGCRCRRGEHHGDGAGDGPRGGRTRVGAAAAALRTPGRGGPPFPIQQLNPVVGWRVAEVWHPNRPPTRISPPSGPRSRTCGG